MLDMVLPASGCAGVDSSPANGDDDSALIMFSGVSIGISGGVGAGPTDALTASSMPGTDKAPAMPTPRIATSVMAWAAEWIF